MRMSRIAVRKACWLLACIMLIPSTASASGPTELYRSLSSRIVVLETRAGNLRIFGSGVVFDDELVVSNCHVASCGIGNPNIKHGSKSYKALTVQDFGANDICIVKVPGLHAAPIKTVTTNGLAIGTRVFALGAPQGLELSFSDGMVSGIRRSGKVSLVQTTAPISPGSSGGGLFDEKGRLVGITTFFLSEGQNLNFAIAVDAIVELVAESKATSKATFTFRNPSDGSFRTEKVEPNIPSMDDSFKRRATKFEQDENWNALSEHATLWTAQFPLSADAWYNLGNANYYLKRYPAATSAFRRVTQLSPCHWGAWYGLAFIYGEVGDRKNFLEAYESLHRIEPKGTEALAKRLEWTVSR